MKLLSCGITATIDKNENRIEIEMNSKDWEECFWWTWTMVELNLSPLLPYWTNDSAQLLELKSDHPKEDDCGWASYCEGRIATIELLNLGSQVRLLSDMFNSLHSYYKCLCWKDLNPIFMTFTNSWKLLVFFPFLTITYFYHFCSLNFYTNQRVLSFSSKSKE